jgi:hypothetical protein
VNSHYAWSDLGDAGIEALAENYEHAVRLAHTAVRLASAHARIYLSLNRQWMTAAFVEPLRSCPARELLDTFVSPMMPAAYPSKAPPRERTAPMRSSLEGGAHRHNAKYVFEGVPEAGGAVPHIAAPHTCHRSASTIARPQATQR